MQRNPFWRNPLTSWLSITLLPLVFLLPSPPQTASLSKPRYQVEVAPTRKYANPQYQFSRIYDKPKDVQVLLEDCSAKNQRVEMKMYLRRCYSQTESREKRS